MRGPVRLVLLLDLLAVAAGVVAVLLAVGMPLAARGALRPSSLLALSLVAVGVGIALGVALLYRSVARPVDRIVDAAARLATEGALPILQPDGEAGGHGLPRAAVAFVPNPPAQPFGQGDSLP